MWITVDNFNQHLNAHGWNGALDADGTEVQEVATFTVKRNAAQAWQRAAPTQAFPGVQQQRQAPMMGRRRPPRIGRGRHAGHAGPPEYYCVARRVGFRHSIRQGAAAQLCNQIGIPAPPLNLYDQ